MQGWTSVPKISQTAECYDVVTHVESNFLQMHPWQRFPLLSLKLVDFPSMVVKTLARADDSKVSKTNSNYMPRAWR